MGCESTTYNTASDWGKRSDGVSYLKVSAIAHKVSLTGYQDIPDTNRRMVWLESPFVSPQEIRIVDIIFGFQPNAFFDQELMGRNHKFSAQDRRNGPLSTAVIPAANACNAVRKVWRNLSSRCSIVSKVLVSVLKLPIHEWVTLW